MHLPALTSEDISPTVERHDDVDQVALQNLHSTPAMGGAIPIAIFDAAMAQFEHDPALGLDFYELALEFDQIPCLRKILNHFDQELLAAAEDSWQAQACHVRIPLAGVSVSSPEFPPALGISLSRLKDSLARVKQKRNFLSVMHTWFEEMLKKDDMDASVQQVLRSKMLSLRGHVA